MTTRHQNLLLRPGHFLVGKVDAAVTNGPIPVLGELDNGAFAVEEEEIFGVEDGEGGVGFFGARGDFGADGVDEDLFG